MKKKKSKKKCPSYCDDPHCDHGPWCCNCGGKNCGINYLRKTQNEHQLKDYIKSNEKLCSLIEKDIGQKEVLEEIENCALVDYPTWEDISNQIERWQRKIKKGRKQLKIG